MTITHAIL